MAKSILMSIRPQYVAQILKGNKIIEVRKKFPKDYVGWVYIYCTKAKPYFKQCKHFKALTYFEIENEGYYLNGKVVARFWCDKVEEIRCSWGSNFIDWSKYPSDERYDYYIGNEMDTCDICRVACLKMEELDNYLKMKNGYAIHISKLEVFDKPKSISCYHNREFTRYLNENDIDTETHFNEVSDKNRLTKAPQSWCYIEGE